MDPALLRAWAAGRSLARGLPAPVADRGGLRVETGAADEMRRWLFAGPGPGIGEVGRAVQGPREPVKLCGEMATLLALLPDGWRPHPLAWFMTAGDVAALPADGAASLLIPSSNHPSRSIRACRESAAGVARIAASRQARSERDEGVALLDPAEVPGRYTLDAARTGAVIAVRVLTATGDLAASGYAADTAAAFVYDRIRTEPAHRRRGLGRAVMLALRTRRSHPAAPELLTATADGRLLYAALGWRVLSPYATATRSG